MKNCSSGHASDYVIDSIIASMRIQWAWRADKRKRRSTAGRAGNRHSRYNGAMIRLTHEAIDYQELTEQVRRSDCGAVVTFLGTVRELTAGRVTVALDYEAYPGMAEKKMAEIER